MGNDSIHKMEKDHSSIITDICAVIAKWWVWGFYIFIGLMGKIDMYLRGDRHENIWQQLGSVLLGFFGGFIAMFFCMQNYPAPAGGYSLQGAIIVPIATLLSDRLAVILWNVEWVRIIEIVTGKKMSDKE